MRRARAAVAGLVVCVVLALPASAKGPSQGVLTGPGIAVPIMLRDQEAKTIGESLAAVVEESGFFQQAFGAQHHRLLQTWSGDLGPRYTITYTMAPGDSASSDIVQYVYPYAEPRPVTFMPRHQAFWGSYETIGGYFQAPTSLRRTLIRAGLPETAPSSVRPSAPAAPPVGSGTTTGSLPTMVLVASVLTVIALGVILVRRRSHPLAAQGR